MTPQQKTRLSILEANVIHCATKLMTFHQQHLVTIHQWRGRNIIESDEEREITIKWQQLSFNYDKAKTEALNFKMQLASIRKYQQRDKQSALQVRMPVSSYCPSQAV